MDSPPLWIPHPLWTPHFPSGLSSLPLWTLPTPPLDSRTAPLDSPHFPLDSPIAPLHSPLPSGSPTPLWTPPHSPAGLPSNLPHCPMDSPPHSPLYSPTALRTPYSPSGSPHSPNEFLSTPPLDSAPFPYQWFFSFTWGSWLFGRKYKDNIFLLHYVNPYETKNSIETNLKTKLVQLMMNWFCPKWASSVLTHVH